MTSNFKVTAIGVNEMSQFAAVRLITKMQVKVVIICDAFGG